MTYDEVRRRLAIILNTLDTTMIVGRQTVRNIDGCMMMLEEILMSEWTEKELQDTEEIETEEELRRCCDELLRFLF